jgi:hypothetical protein
MASIAALSPYHDHHAIHQVTDGDDARFLIVEAVVSHIQRLAFKNECSILKGEATFVECEVPLHGVERKFHLFIVSPKNMTSKYLRIPKKWASYQREFGESGVHG